MGCLQPSLPLCLLQKPYGSGDKYATRLPLWEPGTSLRVPAPGQNNPVRAWRPITSAPKVRGKQLFFPSKGFRPRGLLDGKTLKNNCFPYAFGDKPPRACSGPKQLCACPAPYRFSFKCPLDGKSNCFPHNNNTPLGTTSPLSFFVLMSHDNSTSLKPFTNSMTAFSWSTGK